MCSRGEGTGLCCILGGGGVARIKSLQSLRSKRKWGVLESQRVKELSMCYTMYRYVNYQTLYSNKHPLMLILTQGRNKWCCWIMWLPLIQTMAKHCWFAYRLFKGRLEVGSPGLEVYGEKHPIIFILFQSWL